MYVFLPMQDGGFRRVHISNLCPNELKFIELTKPLLSLRTNESKERYRELAYELLFKEST